MAIKEEFGLSLFGFDLIVPVQRRGGTIKVEREIVIEADSIDMKVDSVSIAAVESEMLSDLLMNDDDVEKDLELELVVIDVNYFPSYKEVPDFPMRLRRFLREKAVMSPYEKYVK